MKESPVPTWRVARKTGSYKGGRRNGSGAGNTKESPVPTWHVARKTGSYRNSFLNPLSEKPWLKPPSSVTTTGRRTS